MPPSAAERDTGKTGPAWFNTTHWSAVLRAGDAESPAAHAALRELCETYWYPLYAFLRSQGHSAPDAQDLVQGFFAVLIDKRVEQLAGVGPEKGKFRSFMLACLKHFVQNDLDKARAQKRGGQAVVVSLDDQAPEERFQCEPADDSSPDRVFDRRWAFTVLDRALKALEAEMVLAGEGTRYAALKDFLSARLPGRSHAEVAVELGTTEGTIRNAVQRLRKRYGELIRAEIAKTIANPTRAAVDEELACLMDILGE